MTVRDHDPYVRVRARQRTYGDRPAESGFSARAHAIPHDDDQRPGNTLDTVDHTELLRVRPVTAKVKGRNRLDHLAEAGLAMVENWAVTDIPMNVAQAWARIAGDPGEPRSRGLAAAWLWLCGLLRALLLTAFWLGALALGTRRRVAGAVVLVAALVAVHHLFRVLPL